MHVDVTARTAMSADQKRQAAERIEALEELAQGPVLAASVTVGRDDNARIERPYHAEGELDVNGRTVRAHVVGVSADDALDDLTDRLKGQLRRFAERRETLHRRPGAIEPGEWRHGDEPTARPAVFPRPPAERQIIRRKTFAMEPMPPVQAAVDMLDLDHDFYLFRDARTGSDAVIHRLREDGRFGLIEAGPASPDTDARWLVAEPNRFSEPIALQNAIEEMDVVDHRFLYFVDRDSKRGNVIYRRYDGHYAVIEEAA